MTTPTDRPLSIKDYAIAVFGDPKLAFKWLGLQNAVLGGIPAVLLTQPGGEERVREVLGRIEHGISV